MKTFQQAFIASALVAAAAAATVTKIESDKDGFTMSAEQSNGLTETSLIAVILGFGVFGSAYLFAVVNIFMDMSKREKGYDDEIEADKQKLHEMGLAGKMAEYEKELLVRFSGKKDGDEGTSQLMNEAMKLTEAQWSKFKK